MAKVIEHGKYWREDIKKSDPIVMIRCPECGNEFGVSPYDCFEQNVAAWCICGCKFIPEVSDKVEDNI